MRAPMWMKVLQVVVFLVTGCLLIYSGYREGYGIALLSALSAFVVTVIIPEAFADMRRLMAKKGRNGPA